MNPGTPGTPPGHPRRQATVLESVEDLRAQIRESLAGLPGAPTTPSPAPPAQAGSETILYRPTLRPSMALLCVYDDGDEAGELIRIRGNSFVIGRVEGDLVIPHDLGMSGRHAEILRRSENGKTTWSLRDLQSTNGTFVRAANVALAHDQEFLIGSRRFRFEAQLATAESAPTPELNPNATRKWEALAPSATGAALPPPALVEVSPGREPRRYRLAEHEQWVGRDPRSCTIVVDDPMVDRRHAKIYRDDKNRWILSNAQSLNGIWARVQDVVIGRSGFFQCGEQRFLLKVL